MPYKLMRFSLVMILLNACLISAQQNSEINKTNWPSFRGFHAEGIAENYTIPISWSVEKNKNIKWKTEIPGLGHSSPAIWGDHIFLTTAISGKDDPEMKVGLYGDIKPVNDKTVHAWKVFCLNKTNGKLIWEKTAFTGVPKIKRHPKSTHANPSPATDGKHVVAFFGSEGLYCYNMDGKLLWKKDLGVLNSTFFLFPGAQWGFASSPIIHENVVVVQCDVLKNSFVATFDVETGQEIWRAARDEFPTWSTPTVFTKNNKTQIVVNGFKHIGGYDFETGEEIWKMKGGGDIPVPTPVVAHDLIFINNAHGKMSPIYAIKTNAKGDISLAEEESSNEYIVWSVRRGGAYMQTPLIYGDYLYNLRGNGSLTCFNAKTGEQIYKEKIGKLASFSASAIAGDNKIYFTGEKGDIYVVRAGADFKLLATNQMNDICMATPAISEGVIFFRTHHYLYAVEEK